MEYKELAPFADTDPGLPPPHPTNSYWQNPRTPLQHHRTTPTLPTEVDTIIIGSGIAGSILSHYLLTSSSPSPPPPTILLLEARTTCSGATGRNGGHCKPMLYQQSQLTTMFTLFSVSEILTKIRFERLNLSLLRSLAGAYAPSAEFRDVPSADVFFTLKSFAAARNSIRALHRAAPELAALLRVVTAETMEGREELRDVLRTPTAVGAVVFPAAQLWPFRLVSGILENAIKKHGLNLQTSTPATKISRVCDKWIVSTPRGSVVARRVFVAANAHTPHLLPQLRGWITPVRAQMAALKPPAHLTGSGRLTHSYGLIREDRHRADYLIQRPSGELLLGGGRHLDPKFGVGERDDKIDPTVATYLRRAVADYFPTTPGGAKGGAGMGMGESLIEKFRRLSVSAGSVWDAAEGVGCFPGDFYGGYEEDEGLVYGSRGGAKEKEPAELDATYEWTGAMGYPKDGRPFVGRVPPVRREDGVEGMEDTRGLYVLAGFEGHGMAFAAGCAKALIKIVAAVEEQERGGDVGHDGELNKHGDLFSWFPQSFVVTPERLGLHPIRPEQQPEDEDEDEDAGDWVVVAGTDTDTDDEVSDDEVSEDEVE